MSWTNQVIVNSHKNIILFKNGSNLGVIEGILSKYDDIEEHSQTPQLQLRALIGAPLEMAI